MKKKLIILAVIATINFANAQEIKKIKATDLVKIIDTSNHPIIVNFWATWCKPCINELKYFEKIVKSYQTKNVILILVSLDFEHDYDKLKTFIKEKGYTSTIYFLNEPESNIIQTSIDVRFEGLIPATLMSNKIKKYRSFHSGQLTESMLKKEIEKLLN